MLAIDIGNSRLKWAVFCDEKIQNHGVFSYNKNNFETVLNESGLTDLLEQVRISCVAAAEIKADFIHWLKSNHCSNFEFAATASQQCGIINSYAKPSTMGVDRWLAMIAAHHLYKTDKQNAICVIDCGTAITLDVVNAKGQHVGGLIMPGYQTMLASLGFNTGNIQVPENNELNIAQTKGLGVSTHEGVMKGCAQIISSGIMAVMDNVVPSKNEKIDYVLTGGDGQWLAEQISQQIKFEPFLVLLGLYYSSL